jgi:hypothetical protein
VAERLPEATLERVEKHLHKCKACRKEVETLQKAQALLLEARLEEPPAPKRGWAEMQMRLGTQEPVATLPSVVWETTPDRKTPALRRAPNLMLVGSCAMLLVSTLVTYRALNLQHEQTTPPILTLHSATGQANKNIPELPKTNPTLTDAGNASARQKTPQMGQTITLTSDKGTPNLTKVTKITKRSTEAKQDMAGYQFVPAGYQDNPEINLTAPPTTALKFSKHLPEPSEKARDTEKDPEYVMPTLTPVSHEKDAY